MNNIAKPYHRILSYIIDVLIYNSPYLAFIYWFSFVDDVNLLLNRFLSLVILFLIVVFCIPFVKAFMISSIGGTFGKLLTGTEIVDSKNKKLIFWMAFLRNYLGYMVSGIILWLGFVWILVDKERRAWHDMICDTYVTVVSKSTILIGIFVIFVMIMLNSFLIKNTVLNFKTNSNVYMELVK